MKKILIIAAIVGAAYYFFFKKKEESGANSPMADFLKTDLLKTEGYENQGETLINPVYNSGSGTGGYMPGDIITPSGGDMPGDIITPKGEIQEPSTFRFNNKSKSAFR
jgi:hypothetical protein